MVEEREEKRKEGDVRHTLSNGETTPYSDEFRRGAIAMGYAITEALFGGNSGLSFSVTSAAIATLKGDKGRRIATLTAPLSDIMFMDKPRESDCTYASMATIDALRKDAASLTEGIRAGVEDLAKKIGLVTKAFKKEDLQ